MRAKLGRHIVVYVLVALGLLVLVSNLVQRSPAGVTFTIEQFVSKISDGQVASATLYERDQRIEGKLKDGRSYRLTYLTEFGDELAGKLADAGVRTEVNPQRPSALTSLLTSLLPILLVVGVLIFFLNQAQGGGSRVMSFGRAKARMVTKEMPKVTFGDVAGLDEAVEEIREIKEYLANPSRFQAMGAKIPRGVLLFGPPGGGKTLLARAVAGEAGVPFFSISGSDFVEMFVGVGAARVRDLFEQARQAAPAIVFVDEIDAVGRHRGAGLGGGHDEREQTLNQLLVEMDGFDPRTGVVLIAATNRPDILDPALLRPGRFDRQIPVDRPDLKGRLEILKVHTKGKPVSGAVDLELVARRTPGFTGADLANVMNEASLLAARRNRDLVGLPEVEEAIDRVMAGPERKSRLITAEERQIIAYHEAGHALVSHLLPHAHPVHKITIIPRGRALGWTLMLPTEDRYLVTKAELGDELAVMLGGRGAEDLIFGDVTSGAQDDIDRVTKVARQMVCEWGMSSLGPMALGPKEDAVFLGRDLGSHAEYSDSVAAEVDLEIRKLIGDAYVRARATLSANVELLHAIAARLLEHETLEGEALDKILGAHPKVRPERARPREVGGAIEGPAGTKRRRSPAPKPNPGLSPA